MYEILLVVHFIIAVLLIGLVLIQHGKGAQAGAAFGSGASQTIFGSQGSGGFLSQSTWALAGLFFVTSITLAYLINKSTHHVVTPVTHSVPVSQSPEDHSQPSVPGETKGSGEVPEVP
jgi:preprotein translocase subunit SecG